MPPHPTTQSRYSKTCVLRERFSVRRHKHAKAFFSSNVPFFAEGRPDGVRKYEKNASKVRKYPSSLDPSEPKGLFKQKRTFFHVRPSIRQNCFSSWHHKIRASGCAQTPCIFRISFAMCKCLPPQLILKSRRTFYISTRIVDPKLFSQEVLVLRLGLNDVWGCRIQHQTGQAQNCHMI